MERVSAGARHVAALTRKGQLYMWGDNSFGQLGCGDKIDRMSGDDAVQIVLQDDEGPIRRDTLGYDVVVFDGIFHPYFEFHCTRSLSG